MGKCKDSVHPSGLGAKVGRIISKESSCSQTASRQEGRTTGDLLPIGTFFHFLPLGIENPLSHTHTHTHKKLF